MRAMLAACMVTVSLAQPVGSPEYTSKLIRFNTAYGEYFRDYFGCPKHAIDPSQCNPGARVTNYGAFLRAAKLAPEVFQQ